MMIASKKQLRMTARKKRGSGTTERKEEGKVKNIVNF